MFEIVLGLLTLILNTFLGLFVFYRNTKSWTNRLFFALTLFINTYLIVNYLSLHPPINTPDNQLLWIRIVMCVTSFIGPTLFLLVHTFPKDKITLKPSRLVMLGVLCILSASVALSPYLFTSIEYPKGEPVPTPGPGIAIFFLDFVGLFIFSFLLLIYKYRKSDGIEKIQYFYFLLGIVATFSLMAISTVIFVVILKFSGLVFLGPNFTLFLIAFTAHAIVRHRFMDIRLIVARSVAYALFIGISISVYTLSLFLVTTYILNLPISLGHLITSTVLGIMIAFSVQPLVHILEKQVGKFLYKDNYDANSFLTSLSHILSSNLILSDLAEKIFRELFTNMKILSSALILFDKEKVTWMQGFNFDMKIFEKEEIYSLLRHSQYKTQDHIILFQEEEHLDIKNTLRLLNINVVLPLVVDNKIIGALFLGEKGSGEIFSTDDISVLKIIAPEVAVAVKNALSYEEIKRFNITLEEEVTHATQKLKKANIRLRELDDLKDEFVSIASHELRTPMTAIKSYLWLALNKAPKELDPQMQKYLDISYKSTERLIRLVNDMLTVSRIERNKIELNLERIDFYDVALQVYDELNIKAEERNIEFNLEPEDPGFYIKGDKEKLREVLQNIVGNALKFTPDNGKITLLFSKDTKNISLAISDTGPGIPAEEKNKLFQKFQKLEYSYTSAKVTQPGSGLGLYISKQIVAFHGGDILVDSVVGKGTTFTIFIPKV